MERQLVGSGFISSELGGRRHGIDGIQPCVGADGFVDIEDDISRGSDDITSRACWGHWLDGKRHEALSNVILIIDRQKTFGTLRRQTRGWVNGLENPESLVSDHIDACYHIDIEAHRFRQVQPLLVARRRAFHLENVFAKAKGPDAKRGQVAQRMERMPDLHPLCGCRSQFGVVLEVDRVGQALFGGDPLQGVAAVGIVIPHRSPDFIGVSWEVDADVYSGCFQLFKHFLQFFV